MSSDKPPKHDEIRTVAVPASVAPVAGTEDRTETTAPDPNWKPTNDPTLSPTVVGLPVAATADAPPPRVPGYRPVRPLGEGAFGYVWQYEDERTRVQVAVKFFKRGTGEQWQLLLAEVKQLALLHADPGMVQLLDVEPDAVPPYYIMSYAPGGSLANRLRDGKLFGVAEAVKFFREAAEALAYVHAKGVRHCDLKPGNVLLDARGRALVADFGQAQVCSDSSPALGTFFYMAPEQADLTPAIADTRWDVYGLGAVLYALLTGEAPRENPAIKEELSRPMGLAHRLERYREWVRRAPKPDAHHGLPGMDGALAAIIDRCLEVNPNRRFRDAGAVVDALARREQRLRQRPLLLFGLVASVSLLLAMALCGYGLGRLALDDSAGALTRQVQSRNQLMAGVMAKLIDLKLQRRADLLAQDARDPELIQGIKDKKTHGAVHEPDERLHALLAEFKKKNKDDYFIKWTLADADGYIIADEFPEPELWRKSWAWRDWFSGGGHQFDAQGKYFPPVHAFHVSQPYAGKGVDEKGDPEPVVVSLSAPIFDPDNPDQVLGVLVGTMHVHGLYDWLLGAGFNDPYSFPVLVNDRRQCLLHRDREKMVAKIRPAEDANPEPLESGLLAGLLAKKTGAGAIDDYRDPLDGKTYLAGYAVGEGSGWLVLVQQDPGTALQPVEHLRAHLFWFGVASMAAATLLTIGLWAWLIWTLRRGEAAAV